jgi:ATP-dependent helicase HepA
VRRVLTDPIQRYLLADEVGLGKTIEAGLIVRQHLIDNPDIEVLIAVPPHLCRQWRSELVDKLRLDQFGEAFECCSHADLANISSAPEILVVDEAHHLVGLVAGPLVGAAERLAELARDTAVLLLLSATPALGEEARFLALLNLLDPVTHPLQDLEGFRRKLERSRNLGRLLLSLDSDSPGLVLPKRCEEVTLLFPSDPVIADVAPRLIEATRENRDAVASLCSTLKAHIADTYRIHQRLIRSRRADAKGWEFMPRGPAVEGVPQLGHVKLESDPTDQMEALVAGIDSWRYAAIEETQDDDASLGRVVQRYRALIEALGTGTDAFTNALATVDPIFEGEDEIISALHSLAAECNDAARIETMSESTRRLLKTLKSDASRHPKIVVFAPTAQAATSLAAALDDLSEDVALCLLTETDSEDEAHTIERFLAQDSTAILFADRRGEEGLNLASADAIVHLDLPWSAARLEQRIGRLDRFGRRQAIIRHRLLLPSDADSSPWAAWFVFLSEGLLIFNRSISDVQFLLDEIERDALLILFRDGPDAPRASAERARRRISDERKAQDEQYALDRIALSDEPVDEFLHTLEDAEDDESTLEIEVDRWLIGTLQLNKRPFAWPQPDPFKLSVSPTTLIPKQPWLSVFSIDDSKPLTWRRRIASRQPEVTLLRPGTPFIDMVDRFTRWDDRGTAFVTWRVAPEWTDAPWLGFRLCFVIEPDVEFSDLLAPTYRELATLRRAQRYLASRYCMLHVDSNGATVSDSVLLAELGRPYRSTKEAVSDVNLSSRPSILEQIIDADRFRQCCRDGREAGRRALRELPELRDSIAAGEALARNDIARRRNRLALRQSGGDVSAMADIAQLENVLPSITSPAIRLDAIGCFVVAQHPPQRTADG